MLPLYDEKKKSEPLPAFQKSLSLQMNAQHQSRRAPLVFFETGWKNKGGTVYPFLFYLKIRHDEREIPIKTVAKSVGEKKGKQVISSKTHFKVVFRPGGEY